MPRKKTIQPRWERHHGKVWLVHVLDGQLYEIPFDEQTRYVDGMVLFNGIKHPGIVKGMMDPNLHLEKLNKLAATSLAARNAYVELEAYQWDQLVAAGIAIEYAGVKRDPVIVDVNPGPAPKLVDRQRLTELLPHALDNPESN